MSFVFIETCFGSVIGATRFLSVWLLYTSPTTVLMFSDIRWSYQSTALYCIMIAFLWGRFLSLFGKTCYRQMSLHLYVYYCVKNPKHVRYNMHGNWKHTLSPEAWVNCFVNIVYRGMDNNKELFSIHPVSPVDIYDIFVETTDELFDLCNYNTASRASFRGKRFKNTSTNTCIL